ncbi:metacaspase-5 [Ziziphus jujuba]|uniref:Metacaspase-5 n=1 Tax=Ziziphus jujuba TaxID=326968 RepID=A0A6P4ABW3_ZIZJJ|nr:metacaspase-5 [Ziziphus jujuba]
MRKKALLIGCNYPGTTVELKGCVNDVNQIKKCLVVRFGFSDEDITVLIDTDDSYTQPTGKNIYNVLTCLVGSAEPGDILFIHYSGHGTRFPLETGEEDETGYDECLVPCDMNFIFDDDLREIVDQVPEGCHITIVTDSCHSGGLIDGAKEQIGDSTKHRHGYGYGYGYGGLRGQHSMEVAFKSRGIQFPSEFRHYNHWREQEEEKNEKEINGYWRHGHVKNRALPLPTLIAILNEKTGKDENKVDVGNLRSTLFKIFGDEVSPKVKKSMNKNKNKNKAQINAKVEGENGGSKGYSSQGMVGSKAQVFLKLQRKLERAEYARKVALAEQAVADIGNQKAYNNGAISSSKRGLPRGGILISGCQTDQISGDVMPAGKDAAPHGAFSNAILTIIADSDGHDITNSELVLKARKLLKTNGFAQQPGLYCNDDDVDASFLLAAHI